MDIEFIHSDGFLSLPPEERSLYVQLVSFADKEGAINSIGGVLRFLGESQDHFNSLVEKGYLIESGGVWFVRHWWVHNTKSGLRFLADSRLIEQRNSLYVDVDGSYHIEDYQGEEDTTEVPRRYHGGTTAQDNLRQDKKNKDKTSQAKESQHKERQAKRDYSGDEERCPLCGFPLVHEAGSLYCRNCKQDVTL